MLDKDLEFMRWCLKQMSAPAITLDCFDRIKKVVEEAQKTPTNSRYKSAQAALAEYNEDITCTHDIGDFTGWLSERLHSPKAANVS